MNFNLDGSGSDSNKSFPAAITIIPSSTYPQLSSFAEDQPTAVEDFQEIKAPIKKNCAKDERRVSFHIPDASNKPKARPFTAINNKSRRSKIVSQEDHLSNESSDIVSVSPEQQHRTRPHSAPGRPEDIANHRQEEKVFDNYLQSLIVVNFEASKSTSKERPASCRSSYRAFERAFRGRVRTAYDTQGRLKTDPESFSSIVGTGTAIRPKTTDAIQDQNDHIELLAKDITLIKNNEEESDVSSILQDVRPFTTQNNYSVSQKRTQTVRNNVDKFQIEQITLRRLRFVIENRSEAPDHLQMVDMLESSHVPPAMIQSYFGSNIKSLHDIRILILQGIDNARLSNEKLKKLEDKIRKQKMVGMNLDNDDLDHLDESQIKVFESSKRNTVGRTPVVIMSVREKPTTPSEILTILKSMETKKALKSRKFAPLKGGGSASYARKSAMEANKLLIKNKNSKENKKNKWKPVSYRKDVSTLPETKSVNLNSKNQRPSTGPVSVLSPKNIIRMVEGRRQSIYQQ